MKKNFFYFAMAACVALCNVACSSDDDGKDNGSDEQKQEENVVIAPPATGSQAAAYTIPEGSVPSTQETITTPEGEEVELSLVGVHFTDGGKAVFETIATYANGTKKTKFAAYDAELNGNVYTIKDAYGKSLGTITRAETRADAALIINITIEIPGIGTVTFETTDPVAAQTVLNVITENVNRLNLCRTWDVTRLKLTLVFDPDKNKPSASRTENSGKLVSFIDLAERNGVSLSDNDKNQMQKEIDYIDVDKFGQLTIYYVKDGKPDGSDVANWTWEDTQQTKIRIKLKEGDMGNKFLSDNSIIDVQFAPPSQCVMIMKTRLEDDACDASLLVNLDASK